MNVLTREQAIKRIKDIQKCIEVDHINLGRSKHDDCNFHDAAISELMAIFDIKEEDLT